MGLPIIIQEVMAVRTTFHPVTQDSNSTMGGIVGHLGAHPHPDTLEVHKDTLEVHKDNRLHKAWDPQGLKFKDRPITHHGLRIPPCLSRWVKEATRPIVIMDPLIIMVLLACNPLLQWPLIILQGRTLTPAHRMDIHQIVQQAHCPLRRPRVDPRLLQVPPLLVPELRLLHEKIQPQEADLTPRVPRPHRVPWDLTVLTNHHSSLPCRSHLTAPMGVRPPNRPRPSIRVRVLNTHTISWAISVITGRPEVHTAAPPRLGVVWGLLELVPKVVTPGMAWLAPHGRDPLSVQFQLPR